jgi:hypothetical protein
LKRSSLQGEHATGPQRRSALVEKHSLKSGSALRSGWNVLPLQRGIRDATDEIQPLWA